MSKINVGFCTVCRIVSESLRFSLPDFVTQHNVNLCHTPRCLHSATWDCLPDPHLTSCYSLPPRCVVVTNSAPSFTARTAARLKSALKLKDSSLGRSKHQGIPSASSRHAKQLRHSTWQVNPHLYIVLPTSFMAWSISARNTARIWSAPHGQPSTWRVNCTDVSASSTCSLVW